MKDKKPLASQIVDVIRDVAGPVIAERTDAAMKKARESNNARGLTPEMLENPKQDTLNGVDYEQRRQTKMTALAGQFVRAAAKTFVDKDLENDSRAREEAFKKHLGKFARTPNAVEEYKKYVKSLQQVDETGWARNKALGDSIFIDGGAIVPPQFVDEIIEFLRPKVVVRALGAFVAPMPHGTMTFPFALTGAVATNVIENAPAPLTQESFGNWQLVAKKMRAIVPVSNDLLRDASPKADLFVQRDMAAELRRLEDLNFLRGSGFGGQMKGLRNQAQTTLLAHNAAGTAGGSTVTEIIQDLVSFPLALENNNITIENGGYAWAPRTKWALMALRDGIGNFYFKQEMLNGTLFGYNFGSTTTQPINLDTTSGALSAKESEILFADFDRVIIGDTEELVILPYPGGSYYDPNVGQVVSGISNDQTVIVAQSRSDIGCRYRGAEVANMQRVTWGA